MESSRPYRPRVSRETRQLLIAGGLAIAALWLLARFRFQDLPVTPNPIPAVIGQFTNGPRLDDLAGEIGQLQTRLQGTLFAIVAPSTARSPLQTSHRVAALRLRDDEAVTWLPAGPIDDQPVLLASDPASGLAVVRVVDQSNSRSPVPWTPRQLRQPRYLIASDVSASGLSLRPVFVGSLDPVESPLWPEPLWAVPTSTDLAPGSFVFTSNAELVGLVIAYGAERVIVPGETLLAERNRLLDRPKSPAGSIGIEVQAMTDAVASVTPAAAGVVVTWVTGAATGHLRVGDVIEAIDGRMLATHHPWDIRMARLRAGETVTLRVHSRGEVQDVVLTATAITPQPESQSLGLTLRGRTRIGAEVVRVERGSAADRSGLVAGDMITLIGDVDAPTPMQLTRSFAALRDGQRTLIAVTRADVHLVTTLER